MTFHELGMSSSQLLFIFSEGLAQPPTSFSFNTHQPIFSIEPKNANILFGIPIFRFHGGFEELQLCDVQVCQEVYEKYNDKSKRLDRRGLTPGNFKLKSNIHHNCIHIVVSVLSDIFGNDVIYLIKEYMLYFVSTTYHLYHSFRAKFKIFVCFFLTNLGRFVLWGSGTPWELVMS